MPTEKERWFLTPLLSPFCCVDGDGPLARGADAPVGGDVACFTTLLSRSVSASLLAPPAMALTPASGVAGPAEISIVPALVGCRQSLSLSFSFSSSLSRLFSLSFSVTAKLNASSSFAGVLAGVTQLLGATVWPSGPVSPGPSSGGAGIPSRRECIGACHGERGGFWECEYEGERSGGCCCCCGCG